MAINNSVSIDEIKKIQDIPMLFVFGKSRSGTTLLQSVLNSHPGIVGPPESKFMMVLYPRFVKIKRWNEKNIYDFIEKLYEFPFFSKRWNIDKAVLTNYLIVAKEILDYALACKIVYYVWGDTNTVLYISDKNPDYFLFTKKIFKLFPDAKFIHLIRDPRDNILSTFNAFEGKNTIHVAIKWLAVNSIIEKEKLLRPGKGFTIFYEDMVRTPEVIIHTICNFLSVPFLSEMIDRKMPKISPDDKDILDALHKRQSKLFSPISPSSIGKWKTDMKPYDVAIVHKITGNYAAQKYGYDMEAQLDKTIHISSLKVIKGVRIYYIWQAFTRMRFRSYKVNKIYSLIKRKIKGNKIVPAQYY